MITIKFIFRPAVQGVQMFKGLQRPLPVHLEKNKNIPEFVFGQRTIIEGASF